MRQILLSVAMCFGLASCGADNVWAPDADVERVAYRHPGPPTITLLTVISNRTGGGAHSALMINGHERVLFDPAGSWGHTRIPERHDVHYGIIPAVMDFYIDYHARITYNVVQQDIVVSPEVAEMAIRIVEQNGPVSKAHCGQSVSVVLRQIPGFEDTPSTWGPKKIMEHFATYDGVKTETFYDDDPDRNYSILVEGLPE